MIYVVSGMQRSGTSAVMTALKEGGMPIYYSERWEEYQKKRYPEARNKHYYEIEPQEVYEVGFPLAAEGMAIKILAPWENLPRMYVHEYRILILHRDKREIAISMGKMNNGLMDEASWDVVQNYELYMNKGISLCRNRKDVQSIFVGDYGDLLNEPEKFFTDLDWPIDIKRAAATIDPSRKSVTLPDDLKMEDLVTGHITPEEGVLSGQIPASEEAIEYVKRGMQVELGAR